MHASLCRCGPADNDGYLTSNWKLIFSCGSPAAFVQQGRPAGRPMTPSYRPRSVSRKPISTQPVRTLRVPTGKSYLRVYPLTGENPGVTHFIGVLEKLPSPGEAGPWTIETRETTAAAAAAAVSAAIGGGGGCAAGGSSSGGGAGSEEGETSSDSANATDRRRRLRCVCVRLS